MPKVDRCGWCNRYQRVADLTPDYDLIRLCPRCLEKLSRYREGKETDE